MKYKEKCERFYSEDNFFNLKVNINFLRFMSLEDVIVLHYLERCIHKSNDIVEGVKWTRQTNYQITDEVRVFTRDKVRVCLIRLENQGIIKSHNFAQSNIDRALSYRLDENYYKIINELNLNKDYINEY